MNKIINRKKNKDEIIGIRKGNVIETDPIKIGNAFNEFFTTIAKKLTKNIKETISFDSFLDVRQEHSMFLTPTDTKEVREPINDLGVNKAKDLYGVSVNFEKILANDISPSLCHIFNESFFTGIFPDLMKVAMTTPTNKEGPRLEASNYRPVSVPPIFSKILEKLMQRRLTKFLDQNKIIYEYQFGFQKNKSTALTVLDLYSQILQTLEKKKIACSVFLDFAKAFDTVDHEILTKKLEHYGIRGVVNEWFCFVSQ